MKKKTVIHYKTISYDKLCTYKNMLCTPHSNFINELLLFVSLKIVPLLYFKTDLVFNKIQLQALRKQKVKELENTMNGTMYRCDDLSQ